MSDDILEVDTKKFKYEGLEDWYYSLSEKEKLSWTNLLNKPDLSDEETNILVETSITIYCKEMNISEIPNTDEFIQLIANTFARNFHLFKLKELGMIEMDGTLNMIDIDAKIKLTEKGRTFGKNLKI